MVGLEGSDPITGSTPSIASLGHVKFMLTNWCKLDCRQVQLDYSQVQLDYRQVRFRCGH